MQSESKSAKSNSQEIVENLFCESLSLDPDARRPFVRERCRGNPELEMQLLDLIANHEKNIHEGFILDRPIFPVDDEQSVALIAEKAGDVIGKYRLLEKIGEGGMGVVYMAEQTHGIRRRVALKIIKLGMDTRQVIARFEVERQALSMFDHPNITRVFDAGATETGRPYFVMELVRGCDILKFVTDNQTGLQQRLELMISICRAVQHSHQKGIIHRDLKPTNILITQIDDRPTPKIIDFGIAKALDQSLTDKTFFTRFAAIMGTPQYMSPEQATSNGTDIDTRSDIYSLGVLMYELITGSTPLRKDDVQQLHPAALVDTLRQMEIETPSTRLASQQIDVNQAFDSFIRKSPNAKNELDSIVMKAVSRDRSTRYQSATEMAADIQRFLNGEPVEAVAPSSTYRLHNYLARNRKKVAAVAAVATLLFCTTIVCTWFAYNTYQANKIKDETVVRLSAALAELKSKHEQLIFAKDEIRDTAETRACQAAIKSADKRFNWLFYQSINHLLPTFVNHSSESIAIDLESEQRPRQFVQMVPPNYLDFDVLLDFKHRNLVANEMRQLEIYARRKYDAEDKNAATPKPNVRQELTAKTIELRSQFFKILVDEYRSAFGPKNERVASALNLYALSLLEIGKQAEALKCLSEAIALSQNSGATESTNEILDLIHDPESSQKSQNNEFQTD